MSGPAGVTPIRRKILFFRNFKRFGGHHLKVWHYFNHALASPDFEPYITFGRGSVFDESNPWASIHGRIVREPRELEPDVLFLSGLDWAWADGYGLVGEDRPALNLIQHVFHAWPDNARYAYLSNKAIRLCLSREVQEAV